MTLCNRLAEHISLALYRAAISVLTPLLQLHLKKRLKRGREHPERWREKLGFSSLPRPVGKLVWLHAVGLGEVLALRGMIVALQACDPKLQFLVTSSPLASADTFGKNKSQGRCTSFYRLMRGGIPGVFWIIGAPTLPCGLNAIFGRGW